MTALFTWWWLALPSLLLPLWWHRQRQRQYQVFPLATAKFLEQAEPQTVQVWRWRDLLLLLLRLVMLMCLISLLAQFLVGHRGDTVFVSTRVDPAWLDAQVAEIKKQNGAKTISLIRYCDRADCELQTSAIFAWLEQHQTQWQGDSHWWLLADEDELAMPAQAPRFTQRFELRLAPQSAQSKKQTKAHEVSVVLKTGRLDQWRAWFKVFEVSSSGRLHFHLSEEWRPDAQLIIWESPLAPRSEWRAPLWWLSEASAYKAMQTTSMNDKPVGGAVETNPNTVVAAMLRSQQMLQTDAPQGRLWLRGAKDWPLAENDLNEALQLFQAWQATYTQFAPIPAQAYVSEAQESAKNLKSVNAFAGVSLDSVGKQLRNQWEEVILALFLVLLTIERVVQHVSRK